MRRLAIGLSLAILLLAAGVLLAAGPPAIDWYLFAGGGGHEVKGSTSLNSIIGVWYAPPGTYGPLLYLPIIKRQ